MAQRERNQKAQTAVERTASLRRQAATAKCVNVKQSGPEGG